MKIFLVAAIIYLVMKMTFKKLRLNKYVHKNKNKGLLYKIRSKIIYLS